MTTKEQSMVQSILVFGATGGIGSEVIAMALNLGQVVTGVARDPSKIIIRHKNLSIVKGDILQPETFERYLEGKTCVVCAVGQTSLKKTILYSKGAGNILSALRSTVGRRCLFISASGLEINPTHNLITRLATRFILQKILANMYEDLTRMETAIKKTDLDWTIIRPPRLTNDVCTMDYRIAVNEQVNNGLTISRADVAHFILANMVNDKTYKSIVEIAY